MTATLQKNNDEQYVIVINRGDIGPMLIDLLKLTPNVLSPFTEVLSKYGRNTSSLSAAGEGLSRDEVFAFIARVLAAPDLLIKIRLGGSMMPFDEVRICTGKSIDEAVAAVSIGENDSYVVQVFKTYASFIKWWTDSFAGKNEETIANYIPPTISLESFLFILHAVDWFKRESYKNALNYAAGQEILVSPEDFSKGMERAIQSKDLRWLLPAFVMLTPGLDRFTINLQPDDAKILNEMQFFNNKRHPKTQEDMLVFGEAGRAMGAEFMTSWFLAAGFEFSTIAQGRIDVLEQIFVAPTALANHYVQLEPKANNTCMINHQVYTLNQLVSKLQSVFKKAFDGYVKQPLSAHMQPETKQHVPKQASRAICTSCNAQLSGEVKFCVECGTPVAGPLPKQAGAGSQPLYCRNCQQQVPQGSKFCTNCGQQV